MHQYAFQTNPNAQMNAQINAQMNAQQARAQAIANQNNNPNQNAMQTHLAHNQQLQNLNQNQINQYQQMQQQFQQFNINTQPQQIQSSPVQNQPNPQHQSPQHQPQPQITNNPQQMMQNIANNFAQNQTSPNHNPQSQPPQPQQQQNIMMLNVGFNPNTQPQQTMYNQAEFVGNATNMEAQNDPNQLQPTEGTHVDVETSILNPEVAEFNPNSGAAFGQTTSVQIQEQLFAQLQNIAQQMQNIKVQINLISPSMVTLNHQLIHYQANQHLLQSPTHQLHWMQIQQQLQQLNHQMNTYQITYNQLEQNLTTTQQMYQTNKDEAYQVPVDEMMGTPGMGGEQGMGMMNQNAIQMNQNNMHSGTTYNLTNTQGVTDVGVGAWTAPANVNDTTNDGTMPLQQDMDPNMVPTQHEIDTSQPQEEAQIQSTQEDIDQMNTSHVIQQEIDEPPQQGFEPPQQEDEYQQEVLEAPQPMDADASQEVSMQVPQENDNYQIETHDVREEEEEEEGEQMKHTIDVPSNIESETHTKIKFMSSIETPRSNDEEQQETDATQPQPPMPRNKPRFGASFSQGKIQPFGRSVTAPESPQQSELSTRSDDVSERMEVISPLKETKSLQSLSPPIRKQTPHKPKRKVGLFNSPYMDRASSFSSQQSNGSNASNNNRFMNIERAQDDTAQDTNGVAINPDHVRYTVMDLITEQKHNLYCNWSHPDFKAIPRSIRMIARGVNNERYMEDVVAMFMRKSANPWQPPSHTGKAPTERKDKLLKQMTGVLNKMTPEKFDKIAKLTMDLVNEFAETKEQMNIIIGLVLEFGIKQPVFGSQYAELCSHLHAHLPKLGLICDYRWVVDDKDVSTTFRKMVIQQTNELFTKHRGYADPVEETDPELRELKMAKKKRNFFAVMVLVGELYNVELIKRNLVFRGVFEPLLPPSNPSLSVVDLEGLCRLLKRCGKKLDGQAKKYVDKYLQKLMTHAGKFDFRTRVLVDEIKEMRAHDWKTRLKKEVAKTKDEIKEDFDAEQTNNDRRKDDRRRGSNRRDDRRRDDRRRDDRRRDDRRRDDRRRDDRRGGRDKRGKRKSSHKKDYDESYYEVGDYDEETSYRGAHGYSTGNLRKVDRYGRRDRRSQSSMNLRKGKKGSEQYEDNHSWGDLDESTQANGGNGRYKM
eukprot:427212_1